MVNKKRLLSAGILTAIAASLCCITPVMALLAGTSGIASSFSWLEPFRPYLISLTILAIGLAWYQNLKPAKKENCNCETTEKRNFIQSNKFLGLVTAFTVLTILFPYYSKVFFAKSADKNIEISHAAVSTVEFKIKGMSCAACEEEVKHEVSKLPGIINAEVFYNKGNAVIAFDSTKVNIKEIKTAVAATGYKVTESIIKK